MGAKGAKVREHSDYLQDFRTSPRRSLTASAQAAPAPTLMRTAEPCGRRLSTGAHEYTQNSRPLRYSVAALPHDGADSTTKYETLAKYRNLLPEAGPPRHGMFASPRQFLRYIAQRKTLCHFAQGLVPHSFYSPEDWVPTIKFPVVLGQAARPGTPLQTYPLLPREIMRRPDQVLGRQVHATRLNGIGKTSACHTPVSVVFRYLPWAPKFPYWAIRDWLQKAAHPQEPFSVSKSSVFSEQQWRSTYFVISRSTCVSKMPLPLFCPRTVATTTINGPHAPLALADALPAHLTTPVF